MTPFDELQLKTDDARKKLLSSTVIVDCLEGRVSLETYRHFLTQAHHHVRHTVSLLMACGSRLPPRLAWLQRYIVDYIAEEFGHEEWIRNDLLATGADADELLARRPYAATELMVSYAYDVVQRVNPVGFFGMVYVLEGTSVALASRAATIIEPELALPRKAFSYLLSHGSLDVGHIKTYEQIVNRFDDADDRATLIHCAKMFFMLYAGIFDSLPRANAHAGANMGRAVA